MKWVILEISFMVLFIILMTVLRIIPHFFDYISFMTTKFLMSIYLLFFYFRFMALTFPVSPTLGPMLVSIILMVRQLTIKLIILIILDIVYALNNKRCA